MTKTLQLLYKSDFDNRRRILMLSKLIYRIWESSTLMTWGAFLSKSLGLIVVLPLILTRFSTAEISLWYLFMIVIGLQMLVDIGFSPTFSRIIAYAMGGAEISDLKRPKTIKIGQPNWETIGEIYSTMHYIYLRLNLLWTMLLISLGTLFIIRPISLVNDSFQAWVAWGIIIAVSTITIWGNTFTCYLQGLNQIALLRRWEMITSIGSMITMGIVLLCGNGLLGLVIAHQGWQILNILRNLWLSKVVENSRSKEFLKKGKNNYVFSAVWPSTWRSGIGILMSYGLIQTSGIIYAQFGSAASVASYLLALRLIQIVSQFSQAPFYSKLPVLARLFSQGKKKELIRVAKRGMILSHWTYITGFISLGLLGEPLFKFIGSNVDFPAQMLWILLGLGFFVERYSAMHIQLYSTTNHIIWHIANGVTGIIYLIVSIAFLQFIGVYAFPIGLLAGYLGFYSWYSAVHSYKAFDLKFMSFEKKTSFGPLAIMLIYIINFFL